MEKNVFLELEYLGTNYFGFQMQNKIGKKEVSVQETLEKALKKLFRKKIRVTYSSRTDKGVHARAAAVNFKVDTKIPFENIKRALNTFLPSDIRVKKVKKVPLDFHSRFWAKSKVYRYIIHCAKEPSVFWRDFSWHIAEPLDLAKMNKAAIKLIGRRDFSSFAKEAKNYKDCKREMKSIVIKKKPNFIYIDIEADGFLRNMARNIISFLVKKGSKRFKIPHNNHPAPPQGLYLLKVKYV
ncbi:MAG: tRNA pseudouridine(38-40) synthase TruA [Candidatus Omnitrophota bacterium]